MSNIQKLNTEMLQEIAAREDSERKLKDALALVEQLSIKDELTHLYNRRGFLTLAEQQAKYLRRQGTPFFLIFADLDGLKGINDGWGHKDGDLALQLAAKVLQGALRDSDIVARLGGDEFTAFVSKVEPLTYDLVLQRIIDGCRRQNEILKRPWKLSISMGYYFAEKETCLSVEEMLDLADSELYKQKELKKVLNALKKSDEENDQEIF